jgi:hypothetical protein
LGCWWCRAKTAKQIDRGTREANLPFCVWPQKLKHVPRPISLLFLLLDYENKGNDKDVL